MNFNNYTFWLLIFPIIIFILICLISKYIAKETDIVLSDLLKLLVICFIPFLNIIYCIAIIFDHYSMDIKSKVHKLLNKKLW